MVNVDSIVYWMGTDNFYIYDGSVKELPCAVQQYVFNRIDPVYKDKVTTGHNKKFKERVLEIMDEDVIMRFENREGKASEFYDIDEE